MHITWKDAKYEYLRLNYKRYYLKWYGLYNDDRSIYCNMYWQIIDALDSVVDDPAPLARRGLNIAIREAMNAMDRIIANFKEVN